MAIDNEGFRILHLLLDPLAPLPLGQMHELGPDTAAINSAGLGNGGRRDAGQRPNFRVATGNWTPEGIKVGIQVAPTAKSLKHALTFQGPDFTRLQVCTLKAHQRIPDVMRAARGFAARGPTYEDNIRGLLL